MSAIRSSRRSVARVNYAECDDETDTKSDESDESDNRDRRNSPAVPTSVIAFPSKFARKGTLRLVDAVTKSALPVLRAEDGRDWCLVDAGAKVKVKVTVQGKTDTESLFDTDVTIDGADVYVTEFSEHTCFVPKQRGAYIEIVGVETDRTEGSCFRESAVGIVTASVFDTDEDLKPSEPNELKSCKCRSSRSSAKSKTAVVKREATTAKLHDARVDEREKKRLAACLVTDESKEVKGKWCDTCHLSTDPLNHTYELTVDIRRSGGAQGMMTLHYADLPGLLQAGVPRSALVARGILPPRPAPGFVDLTCDEDVSAVDEGEEGGRVGSSGGGSSGGGSGSGGGDIGGVVGGCSDVTTIGHSHVIDDDSDEEGKVKSEGGGKRRCRS
jgi:uncharacterized membrane protein YgcG